MKKKWFQALSAALAAALLCLPVMAQEEKDYRIGICQLVQHDALDAATRGFQDAVTASLGEENVTFDQQNAQGDSGTCATIINSFVSGNVDLILANATAALQAAATGTDEIPILGTSVTDYGVALELEDFDGVVGGNISGTSDLAPLTSLAQMLVELFPDADQVGLLYCSAEPNSLYQVNIVEAALEELGLSTQRYAFADANDLFSVASTASERCDVIYVPTDNTIASIANLLNNIFLPAGVPVVTGDEGTCDICGIATLSAGYYDLGYATGLMAVRILAEGEDISTMPIEYAPHFIQRYNPAIAQELGIEIPNDFVAIEGNQQLTSIG